MLQTYTASTIVKEEIAPGVFRFVFTLPDKSIAFNAGQYLLLNVPGGYRQYSISSSPHQTDEIEIIVDIAPMGIGSKYLQAFKLGEQVTFRAPLGVFMLQKTNLPKIFLATGTGIAPIKSMVLDLAHRAFVEDYHILWGLRSHKDAYFKRELNNLDRLNRNFHYHICYSREDPEDTTELKGYVQDGLRILFPNNNFLLSHEFYLCGRPNTVDEVKKALRTEFTVPESHIFNEKFT
ncbi:MAG: FAD-dependent oxidoreductase [Patescibacteria group bacterium]|jgi:NAD(P)H-flavin reductase